MANKKEEANLPSELEALFAEDSGKGFEEVTSSDIQIPFLRMIQQMSPQINKKEASYIEGAGGGDIFNTVTNKYWEGSEGVVVIPVYFQMKLLEFVPRDQGGGFVGELSAASEEVRTATRDQGTGMEMLVSGNELVRTAQHYIKIVHEDGSLENAIVDMKKTQLKKSRLWVSMMTMQKRNGKTLPSYACTYRLKTVEDGNDKGSWNTWSVAHEGMIPGIEAYNDCKELHGSISSGALKIAPPPSEELLTGPSTTDEDIPF
jgi:hypothetical protein|tara:strand:- start:1501 stop:2280 length:780 start_codon:yes stop_codon:yes gene_type:complete